MNLNKGVSLNLPYIDAQRLFDWLRMPMPFLKFDAVFIAGSGSIGPVRECLKLFHGSGYRPIVFTSKGGNFGGNTIFGRDEVLEYKEELQSHIPDRFIFHPAESEWTTNTLLEATNGMKFLRQCAPEAKTVVLCGRGVHMRRLNLTFRKHNPDLTIVNRADDEVASVELLERMCDEVGRIQLYGKKGDLLEEEIPDFVWDIVGQIERHLASKTPRTPVTRQ